MGATAGETIDCDVLVVGAGAAGLRAAIAADACGARTAIVCKSLLGKAATVLDEQGMAAALDNGRVGDGWRSHFRDTMIAGGLLNDWRMAKIHAEEAPQRVLELEAWGALFDRTRDGLILQQPAAGHGHARIVQSGARCGLEVLRALQHQVLHRRIDVHMECSIQRLLARGGRTLGAFGYRRASGDFVAFRARAIVLATGACSRLWPHLPAVADATGDGFALALDAGAMLVDMDFGVGGIRADAGTGATAVEGLFAAGDALGGLHGAAALAGNALSAALVFGMRAGEQAALSVSRSTAPPAIDDGAIEAHARELLAPLARTRGPTPYALLRELQECMNELVDAVPTGPRLRAAAARMDRIGRGLAGVAVAGPRAYNTAWHLAHDLRAMLGVARAVTQSALARLEAGLRGNVALARSGSRLAARCTPAPEMPADIKRLIDWSKPWLDRKPASGSGAAMPAADSSANTA